jgi:hypothetical protein
MKKEKSVEITIRLDSQFVRLLNANITLSNVLQKAATGKIEPMSVLALLVLGEARGAFPEDTRAKIPSDWQGQIDVVPERRRVWEGEPSDAPAEA